MTNSFAYLDAKSKAKVWDAYAEYFANEEILGERFNENSGYVYIALENGIQIASSFGQDVEYVIFNYDTGEEMFFDKIEDLKDYLTLDFNPKVIN
jgi:hypothetical protein